MANQAIPNPPRAFDLNGYVSAGAKATFFQSGTNTLVTIYADKEETTVAANPAIADANGVFPQRFVTGQVKVVITSASDETLYTLDPAPVVQSIGAGASQISFEPNVDLPFTNVQDAVQGAAAKAAAGFAAFGIGITGNAGLLPDLDATNIGAGVYRFDGTTTGTFPSGVAAADGGLIETWRQASNVAMMELGHGTSDRVFRRRMAAGVWGAWREVITANQAAVEGDILYRGASAWTRLAKGTALQALRMNAGATAPEWASGVTTDIAPVTLSGASTDISTSIPSGVNKIEIFFNQVSLTGTDDALVQIGAGSFVTTGYNGASSANGAGVTHSDGFGLRLGSGARRFVGTMTLNRVPDGNVWVMTSVGGWDLAAGASYASSHGRLSLGGALARIRMVPSGSDTFDAGTVSVRYS